MFWNALFFLASLLGLAVASYTDLKKRIVSNRLSYSLIAIGLVGHIAVAIVESNAWSFIYSAAAAALAFIFAYILWKLGVWAGGDVKLFSAIAALNPANPYFFNKFGISLGIIGMPYNLPLFFVSLFVFSVFAMFPYGTLIALHGLSQRKKERDEMLKDFWIRTLQTLQGSAAIVGFAWALSYLKQSQLLLLPLLLLLGLIKNRIARIAVIAILFAASLICAPMESIVGFFALFAILLAFYLLIKLYFVSSQMLRRKKKISELQEGDIVAESFIETSGGVQRIPQIEIKRIINYLATNKLQELKEYLQPSGRVIASSRKAMGLTEEQINELKELARKGKIEDNIEVKLSAPFVPAMLIAYLVLNAVGDALWALVL